MLSTGRLLRVLIELIFMAAGALLLWVSWTGQYLFDPRRPSWLALSILLIFWGLRRFQRGRGAGRDVRIAEELSGASLALAGVLMLSLAWAPFGWVDWLLGATGGLFVLRGVLTTALVLAARPSAKAR